MNAEFVMPFSELDRLESLLAHKQIPPCAKKQQPDGSFRLVFSSAEGVVKAALFLEGYPA